MLMKRVRRGEVAPNCSGSPLLRYPLPAIFRTRSYLPPLVGVLTARRKLAVQSPNRGSRALLALWASLTQRAAMNLPSKAGAER